MSDEQLRKKISEFSGKIEKLILKQRSESEGLAHSNRVAQYHSIRADAFQEALEIFK